jgi:phosphotransferase system enzyme I (PtsP)
MLPMVTEINELRLARELLNKEVRHLSRFGHQLPRKMQFGAMLEVPSLHVAARRIDGGGGLRFCRFQRSVPVHDGGGPWQFARRRSVRSVGPAIPAGCDRSSRLPSEPVHPADAVWRDCRQAAFGHGACSGLVSATISMAPAAIGPVKSMLLSLDLGKLEASLLAAISDTESGKTVREFLTDFADANGVSL